MVGNKTTKQDHQPIRNWNVRSKIVSNLNPGIIPGFFSGIIFHMSSRHKREGKIPEFMLKFLTPEIATKIVL